MSMPHALVWFRSDLRIADNAALTAAIDTGLPVIALFVLEEHDALRPLGGAARWWLAQSLRALGARLRALNVPLVLRRGDAERIVADIARTSDARSVFWNRRYDPGGIAVDTSIKAALGSDGITVQSFAGALLHEPWEIRNGADQPYRVFTPFWKAHRLLGPGRTPLPVPPAAPPTTISPSSEPLENWHLEPTQPNWAMAFPDHWQPGEAGAIERLYSFLDSGLHGYSQLRDRPDQPATSRLSAHLRFGEITPAQIMQSLAMRAAEHPHLASDSAKFAAEIGWREFGHHLLFHWPDLPTVNFQPRFNAFPWCEDDERLRQWQKGQTGIPIIDAGMRQLWQTGWMHNRVRMLVASFLVKNLLIDWRLGEQWFWDTLVDADIANNAAGWQWVAGSGADAAPYFRIFNPVTQAINFDPEGDYVRTYVPELACLPARDIHRPAEAPPLVLKDAGVTLGRTYPEPIVDLGMSRERALAAFRQLNDR